MKEEILLETIYRIQNFIENKQIAEAKDYVKLEIDNLTGATEERCKNTKYHFYPTFCKYCSIKNCISNPNNPSKKS